MARDSKSRGLAPATVAFRAEHAAIAAGFLFAIGYVWSCALTAAAGDSCT